MSIINKLLKKQGGDGKKEEEGPKLVPCTELEEMKYLGTEKLVAVLQDEEGFVYLEFKKNKFRHKMKLEAAKLILSTNENLVLEGADVQGAKLIAVANSFYTLMREAYDLKVSDVEKMCNFVKNIYKEEKLTTNAIEMVAFLRDKYALDNSELDEMVGYLQNAAGNDINLATNIAWGKSKYALTLKDVFQKIDKADEKQLAQSKEDVQKDKQNQIKREMARQSGRR